MKIFVPREWNADESRAALTPTAAARLVRHGLDVETETGLGDCLREPDEAYRKAGAVIADDRRASLFAADVVLRLRPPPLEEIDACRSGCLHISYLDPFRNPECILRMATAGVTGICMELIPRTTLAQKMDALSSQANLAGYVAVILVCQAYSGIFPMMMTPAGTLSPARVFVIGAGVAGLQAIATARRLGARVEAFDTRPAVEEQVKSLGARFLKIDLGEMTQTRNGYANQLRPEQLERQRKGMARQCALSDVVITTAHVFGCKPPVILTRDMVAGMRPGSLIVDLAAEFGGNCELTEVDREVEFQGVRILGLSNFPGRVARAASEMYASNLAHLIEHFLDRENRVFRLDLSDEILAACVVTHGGEVIHETIRQSL